jgi:hypothetical protein
VAELKTWTRATLTGQVHTAHELEGLGSEKWKFQKLASSGNEAK